MAFLEMDITKLKHNYDYLDDLFKRNNIQWAVVSKVLCGNRLYLSELLNLGVNHICDSRLINLKVIKSLKPDVETIYIKPPSRKNISSVIKYADISVNTEIATIKALSRTAKKMNTKHKIIIMLEMGELREGVLRDEFVQFYENVFKLDNIQVVGIGTNFSCLYGVLPHEDKLIQLSLYEQLIEAKFNRNLPYVSGGSSVVIPILLKNTLPKGINHFRVGETLYLGTNVFNNSLIMNMEHGIFKLYAEIIELMEKPVVPSGIMGSNVEGKTYAFDQQEAGKVSFRAIVDLGLLDVDEKHIWCSDEDVQFAGASSDMLVIDLNDNPKDYKVGDILEFQMDYMGLLRLMNSRYIEKRVTK